MHFQMPLAAMKQLLERANIGQKREDRFNDSPFIPGTLLAQFEVVWHAVLTAETEIAQGDRLPFVAFQERQKTVVASIGGRPLPIHDTPVLIDDPTHFHPDDPAPIAFAFPSDLLRRTPFAQRVNQFNAVAVGDGEKGRHLQKPIRPVSMGGQQALQARALGQARKEIVKFALQPPMEVAEASAFERKQRANGHEFTGIKFGLRMFRHVLHPIINGAKEMCNNVFRLHESLLENGFGQRIFFVTALVRQLSRTSLFIFNYLATSTNSYLDPISARLQRYAPSNRV